MTSSIHLVIHPVYPSIHPSIQFIHPSISSSIQFIHPSIIHPSIPSSIQFVHPSVIHPPFQLSSVHFIHHPFISIYKPTTSAIYPSIYEEHVRQSWARARAQSLNPDPGPFQDASYSNSSRSPHSVPGIGSAPCQLGEGPPSPLEGS